MDVSSSAVESNLQVVQYDPGTNVPETKVPNHGASCSNLLRVLSVG